MLDAKTVRKWYRVHQWTSLACTVFLLVSCVTGLPLIFGDEIARIADSPVPPAAVASGAPLARLDNLVAVSLKRYPGMKVLSVSWDEEEPRVLVEVAPSFDPPLNQDHTLIFDAHTGNLLEESKPGRDFMSGVRELHTELFAGLAGQLFLGAMAVLFVIALVSGFAVYGPFMRKLKFGTFRTGSPPRVKWLDVHNLIGIVILCWALVIGLTGVMNTLANPLFELWSAQELPHLVAPYQGKPLPVHLGSLDVAVQTARRALPDMQITLVIFPNDLFSSPRHYLIWAQGKTTLSSRLFTPALVDAETEQITPTRGLPWYLRALEVSRPLHFGDYGGLPLKILWAVLDLALILVLVSGLSLWGTRRRTQFDETLAMLMELETPDGQGALG